MLWIKTRNDRSVFPCPLDSRMRPSTDAVKPATRVRPELAIGPRFARTVGPARV